MKTLSLQEDYSPYRRVSQATEQTLSSEEEDGDEFDMMGMGMGMDGGLGMGFDPHEHPELFMALLDPRQQLQLPFGAAANSPEMKAALVQHMIQSAAQANGMHMGYNGMGMGMAGVQGQGINMAGMMAPEGRTRERTNHSNRGDTVGVPKMVTKTTSETEAGETTDNDAAGGGGASDSNSGMGSGSANGGGSAAADCNANVSSSSSSEGRPSGGVCAVCHKTTNKRCGKCKKTFYCSQTCQKRHASSHRLTCHEYQAPAPPTPPEEQQAPLTWAVLDDLLPPNGGRGWGDSVQRDSVETSLILKVASRVTPGCHAFLAEDVAGEKRLITWHFDIDEDVSYPFNLYENAYVAWVRPRPYRYLDGRKGARITSHDHPFLDLIKK
ncbi:unnamed protein product [Vitrella brassicaformis CCMP3155]|uniref:MYND-type domain-containing protein n=1 Tax=Vitrella brassicaformis (strain CCMP3155) TaxID=1169540 RepID=A0A0G4GQQ5_VITBC|nr:unnamed protein product [Vitrella brassicaformis CCMP3155]|eukprot:CEM32800.1 unnamed protein product [Vitrella brassicaformis CCMP3155]